VSTVTSLSVRALLNSAITRLGLDSRTRSYSGLTAPAKALAVSAAAHASRELVFLYVVPTDAEIETATNDVRFFLSSLEAVPDVVAERIVLPVPSHQVDPYRGMAPHFQVTSARARALHAAALGTARVIIASAQALMPRLAAPESILTTSVDLRPGVEIDPHALAGILVEGGYERQDPVDEHGEFSLRGGILDVYPGGEASPVRIEFVGDSVESIRRFDPSTQRSIETLDQFQIVPVKEGGTLASPPAPATSDQDGRTEVPLSPATMFDYLRASRTSRILVAEPDDVRAQIEKWTEHLELSFEQRQSDQTPGDRERRPPAALMLTWSEIAPTLAQAVVLEELSLDTLSAAGGSGPTASARDSEGPSYGGSAPRHVATQPAQEFRGRIADWIAQIKQARDQNETVLFVASTHGRAERTVELLHDYEIRGLLATRADERVEGAVLVVEGLLSKGFRLADASLQIYAESDVFEEERRRTTASRKRSLAATFLSDLRDLKVGDHIVHVDHGIGQFVGLKQLSIGHGDIVQEFLELRYHGDDKMFVPVERLDLIQKYTGATPSLDRLGGTSWEKAKKKVKKAMRDMAEELLKLYAARRAVQGYAFQADTHWQEEFEGAFEWDLTADQATAIGDIKRDMESPSPMDRLLCGDVGYGKTEVAMRASFKAVMDGKQVAVLAPTTVLAFQHLETLKRRFAAFPVRIDMISRFRTKPEIKAALEAAAAGRLDILVGTHRLLSKDVVFRDLGLLIVDEEQRFGVAHKERIKQMRKSVDVLTMTATPIPRTLNMSLVGIRDMSVIETPPKDRLAIQTNVVKFDSAVIARAIRNEMARGGQVYFVHNRVESIFSLGNLIQRLVPEARVVIGHGQMSEDILERAMLDFMAHKFDVLLATTIVENGLDIPNANTIIINRADRYGLSQLYQLRGRVGRSDRPAYAYLLIPPEQSLSPVARKRLAAIKEFSDLGSGFRVAALDLEIRGAGNLLGGEQSGHIDAVGFEMYMKLLEETVRELKGEDLEDDLRATVNLRIDFRIDDGYVPDMNQRLMIYRRIAAARSEDELTKIMEEMRDRYGPSPVPVLNLADYGRIRVLADELGIETINREGSVVVLKFREKAKVDPMRVINLVRDRGDLQLFPPSTLKMDLRQASAARPQTPAARLQPPGPRVQLQGPGLRPQGSGLTPRERREPAWWTARATAGEVTPGFSKAEILKPKAEDPRAPGGILERVEELLEDLRD
jgi:transcription-repair coupling factor (superfamily II helicase)